MRMLNWRSKDDRPVRSMTLRDIETFIYDSETDRGTKFKTCFLPHFNSFKMTKENIDDVCNVRENPLRLFYAMYDNSTYFDLNDKIMIARHDGAAFTKSEEEDVVEHVTLCNRIVMCHDDPSYSKKHVSMYSKPEWHFIVEGHDEEIEKIREFALDTSIDALQKRIEGMKPTLLKLAEDKKYSDRDVIDSFDTFISVMLTVGFVVVCDDGSVVMSQKRDGMYVELLLEKCSMSIESGDVSRRSGYSCAAMFVKSDSEDLLDLSTDEARQVVESVVSDIFKTYLLSFNKSI